MMEVIEQDDSSHATTMSKDKAPKQPKPHIPPLRFSTLLKVLMELDDVPQPPASPTGACDAANAELEKEPDADYAPAPAALTRTSEGRVSAMFSKYKQ